MSDQQPIGDYCGPHCWASANSSSHLTVRHCVKCHTEGINLLPMVERPRHGIGSLAS